MGALALLYEWRGGSTGALVLLYEWREGQREHWLSSMNRGKVDGGIGSPL
jgi:hypothetical protein